MSIIRRTALLLMSMSSSDLGYLLTTTTHEYLIRRHVTKYFGDLLCCHDSHPVSLKGKDEQGGTRVP